MSLTGTLAVLLTLLLGLVLGALVGALWQRTRIPGGLGALAAPTPGASGELPQVNAGIDRLAAQLQALESGRAEAAGQLREQVENVRRTAEEVRREAASLGTALRRPHVRGQWGELQLRRTVELAGMVDRCDFSEQVHTPGTDGEQALRPDLVVHLAGGRHVVVDSKVPLEAFLDACDADPVTDPEEHAHHLARHARAVRTHATQLGSKRYWRTVASSPEFVVLFLPSEAFLSAALEADRSLLEFAADQQVVLATPTTLIALLKTVAHGWRHEQLAERAEEILQLARDLYTRLGTMGGHLDQVGRSLGTAVEGYNRTVGSLESRVLVTARNLEELGAVSEGRLRAPRRIDLRVRRPSAPELEPGPAAVDSPTIDYDRAVGD